MLHHTPYRVGVLASDTDRIELTRSRPGVGYRLTDDAEGFGQGLVENELTPRLGRRGSMLGVQREAAGKMLIPVVVSAPSKQERDHMVARLRDVLKPADGVTRFELVDPSTDEGRYRDIAYTDGLDTPSWSGPTTVKYVIDVDYLDPWAYSTNLESAQLPIAPGISGGFTIPLEFPLSFARSGQTADRWATNNGPNPAPVVLRFDGPITNPEVTLQGHWTFRVNGSLAWDEYLIVDPTNLSSPTAHVYSTTRPGRRAAYNMISTSSRLTDLIIPPGQHALSFTGLDPTFTASMTASWRHTYASIH